MRDQVVRAIRRDHPDYVPLIIWNQDFDQSDIVYGEIQKHFLEKIETIQNGDFIGREKMRPWANRESP